ncbi:MAG: FAD/NAD(P)-binding protein [bacterium]|nr:FAD/NAD(P)-binding protein [bacterium]
MDRHDLLDVAVIGGGVSGSAIAVALAAQAPAAFAAAIFDPAPLGPGTAYAPQSASLLLNGPVRAMSAVPGDARHFARYLVDEPDDALICRARYGSYLRATAAAALAAHAGLRHVASEIVEIERSERGFALRDRDGRAWLARNVVFAMGNFAPNASFLPEAVRTSPDFANDPWRVDVGRFGDGDLALFGSRLTAMDTVALLDERAFRGRIHLISRHGRTPFVEDPRVRGDASVLSSLDTTTPARLLHTMRAVAARYPGDWRAIVEALRPVTAETWERWSLRERRRFLRHLESFWAIHRYRVPPATHAVFARLRASGRVLVHAARITGAHAAERGFTLELTHRGATRSLRVAGAINCTGPNADLARVESSLVRDALVRGILVADPLRLGVAVAADLRVLRDDGTSDPHAFAIGPLVRGRWYETTAIPEITRHAAAIARELLREHRITPSLEAS